MKIVKESKDSIDIFFDNKEIYEYTNGMMPRDKVADIMIRMAQEHKLSFFNTDKGNIISFIVLCNNYSMIRLIGLDYQEIPQMVRLMGQLIYS